MMPTLKKKKKKNDMVVVNLPQICNNSKILDYWHMFRTQSKTFLTMTIKIQEKML